MLLTLSVHHSGLVDLYVCARMNNATVIIGRNKTNLIPREISKSSILESACSLDLRDSFKEIPLNRSEASFDESRKSGADGVESSRVSINEDISESASISTESDFSSITPSPHRNLASTFFDKSEDKLNVLELQYIPPSTFEIIVPICMPDSASVFLSTSFAIISSISASESIGMAEIGRRRPWDIGFKSLSTAGILVPSLVFSG